MPDQQPTAEIAAKGRAAWVRGAAVLAPLAAILLWAYWPTLEEVARRWANDARYSHGYLVPMFALGLLWYRRGRLGSVPSRPSWSGLGLMALGAALHVLGAVIYFDWIDGASMLVVLAGVSVLLGGWRSLRWSGPSIAFLVFMFPLPYRIETSLAGPLQRLATVASTFTLQTLGLPALSEGNVILLDDVRIGVVEACNGLGMLITFFAISTAVAMVIDRPWLDRVLMVLSAIPVALITNVTRIVVTGVLHRVAGGEVADMVFHDLAGWLMMPMALGLLWLELRWLGLLLVEVDRRSRKPVGPRIRTGPRPGPKPA